MKKITQGRLCYYQFKHFSKLSFINHGIFTRKGGVSKAPYDSLNIGYNVGDDPLAVQENQRRIEKIMGAESKSAIQTHSKKVHIVNSDWDNKINGDSLVANQANILLMVKTADCQPILLADHDNKIIAAIHSGWRGSVLNIIESTIIKMCELGSKPENIIAGIGPSLGPCCAEFINYKQELPKNMWKFSVKPDYFDFWAISKNQLIKTGIKEKNIEISKICTRCRTDLFYSYRKNKISGRFASVIGLKSL